VPEGGKNEPRLGNRLLLIVSRSEPTRYTHLERVFGNTLEVILDRRVEDRRRSFESTAGKRRHGDRRQHDTTKDLETLGWALARR